MSPPEVWKLFKPLGQPASTPAFGSIAAPLLAGFSLVAIIELLGRVGRGTRGDLAVLAFTVSSALLIFAIQAALTAASWQVPPAERLAMVPESRTDGAVLQQVRNEQWLDERVAYRHRGLFEHAYNNGIVAFLLGLVAVLLPGPGGWTWPRALAVGVAAAAATVEVVLSRRWPPTLLRRLSPTRRT